MRLKASARVLFVFSTPGVVRSASQYEEGRCAVDVFWISGFEHAMRAGLSATHQALSEAEALPPDCDLPVPTTAELADLYRSHKAGLVRFAAGFGSAEDAEDVVQQVFVRVAARSFPQKISSPAFYLRQAVRNLLRDKVRRAGRTFDDAHIPIDDIVIADSDPVCALEARDRLARIEEAVFRLKPLTRQIFLACRVNGYSYVEIADQTGLSVRGVEKQMNRALKQLERHLSRDG